MRNVFITGADGFIGRHLAEKLKQLGCEVTGTQYPSDDVLDWTEMCCTIKELKFDTIFHLGAKAIVGKAESGAHECFETNVMGTVNILEACRLFKEEIDVKAIVVASSDKAYGRSPPPYREDETPLDCSNPYDTSKACQDMIARCYAETYGLPVTVTRCSNVYGPGDLNWSRLIPYLTRCFIKGESPQLHSGRGDIYKEWIYVDDVVDAYILLAEKIGETRGKAYNIGSGFTATRDEVIAKFWNFLGTIASSSVKAEFRQIGSQALDSGRIRALGWAPKVSFAEGLKRTVEWYKQHLRGAA